MYAKNLTTNSICIYLGLKNIINSLYIHFSKDDLDQLFTPILSRNYLGLHIFSKSATCL